MGATVLSLEFERRRLHAFQRGALIWFVLADVCECLGVKDASDVAERLDADQKDRVSIPTLGGAQQMLIISEDAVYAIACTSRKPIAKRFARWLYREVLPEIRQTGSYQGGAAPLDALIGTLQPELGLVHKDNVVPLARAPSLPVVVDDDIVSETEARAVWKREQIAPEPLPQTTLDCWRINNWYVRRRNDAKGSAAMVWITPDDALSTAPEDKWVFRNPNDRSDVYFCFGKPYPPAEIAIAVYDTLGPGPAAPIAKATLAHFLS